MKLSKITKAAHTPKTQKGHGDNFGSGVKQPLGKIREVMGISGKVSSKVKTPPKKLA